MKRAHAVLVALAAALVTACAVPPPKEQPPEGVPAAKPAPVKAAPKERKEPPSEGEAGKAAAESMFAKLKIGMTLRQVESLIGAPTRQWRHATEKARIAYYFGPDRWVIQYAYKGEGVLTFNSEGEQVLTRIEVNKSE
jgi:hypothetical protein